MMAKSKSGMQSGRLVTRKAPAKTRRMPTDLATRIDAWAKANGKESHSEAMRHLLEIGLIAPTPQSAPSSVAPAPLSKAAIKQIVAVERSEAMQGKRGRAQKHDREKRKGFDMK
jgi:hypothetical protein